MTTENAWPADIFMGVMPEIGQLKVLKQLQFPDEYDSLHDHLIGNDLNYLMLKDEQSSRRILKKHIGTSKPDFKKLCDWIEAESDGKIFAFLIELLVGKHEIPFTGYRICIKQCADGLPTLLIEIFYKNADSDTQVFTKTACH